ncbi:vasotab-like isoform X2 [Rhodnius prolixus]|uniref:vasotab-like isoform X2 n=1 Tax=Rhodnius prolixus TaxID=13249 RepID=UPI003D18DB0E
MKQFLLILAFLLTTFLARVGGAGKCPIHICSVLDYDPVCARDIVSKKNRPFGNECEFDRANCESKKPVYEIASRGLCTKKL